MATVTITDTRDGTNHTQEFTVDTEAADFARWYYDTHKPARFTKLCEYDKTEGGKGWHAHEFKHRDFTLRVECRD